MPTDPRFPDAVVVLGSALRRGRLPAALVRRLEVAAERWRTECARGADPVLVLSGGRGTAEQPAEAMAMRDWLVQRWEMSADRIVLEDRSDNTWQNLQYTRRLLGPDARIVLISSGYHLPRIRLMLWLIGWRADLVATPTPPRALPQALLRELIAFPALILPGQRRPSDRSPRR